MPRTKNQKLRILYIAQYLLEYSDENHSVNAGDIIKYLEQELDFTCERRSIYRDIAALRDEFGMDIDGVQGGKYTLLSRQFDFDDLLLLAQCVYATKFISKSKAEKLVQTLGEFCSIYDRDRIESEVFLCDRVKTTADDILSTINKINYAMSSKDEGKPRTPTKITFKYMKYKINNLHSQVERRQGYLYKVSPYKLIINEGNYYLLAFDDHFQQMRTYRIDRMKEVKVTKEPRDGAEAFAEIDLSTYTKRVFSMFEGKNGFITIKFVNTCMNAVVEKIGTDNITYKNYDSGHFTVTMGTGINEQFYGWLCTFGNMAKVIEPETQVAAFKDYIKKITTLYEYE